MLSRSDAFMNGVGMLALCAGAVILLSAAAAALTNAPAAVLRPLSAAFRDEVSRLGDRVPAGRASATRAWEPHVRWVNELVDRGDVSAATYAWRDAYGAALDGPGWDGLLAAGDAFVRIADLARAPRAARSNAREAYLAALIRAERADSVDGVLRTAAAFAGLGEPAVAEQCVRIARRLAERGNGLAGRSR
jgi:hypothetical protein